MPKVTQGKTRPRVSVTTLPTFPTGPFCSLWHPLSLASRGHSIAVPLFSSPEPAAQALATRSQGRRQRSQGEALFWDVWLQVSKTDANSLLPSAPALGCLSPPGAGTPGQLGTYHLPTHRSLSTPTRLGHLLPAHRHKAHSANPDTVSAFELFAVSGEARRVHRP